MNKAAFMNELTRSLAEYGVNDAREILLDFEQHFEDGIAAGETEDEVCEKLGDPVEIAKQYIPDADITVEEKEAKESGFDSNKYSQPYGQTQPAPAAEQGFKADTGKITLVLCIDVFVLSWALPSLLSLVVSLYGCTIGFGSGGIATIIGGILMNFIDTSTWMFSTLSPISTVLFGVVMLSICVLLVIASIAATKGCVNIVKQLVNWHSETFVGKKICNIEEKNTNTGEAV